MAARASQFYTAMMIRILFLMLISAGLCARASDLIAGPASGASATVTQPHETAQLIPESTMIEGKPFDVILHLHSDPGWHTYWINPGDAGLATRITWTLPPGFTAGPIQWPTPEKHSMGGIMTYGYAGDVYLITTITPPTSAPPGDSKLDIKAKATWLVCEEECIPGKAELTLNLSFADPTMPEGAQVIENKDFFAAARARLPVPNTLWNVQGDYSSAGETSDTSPKPSSGLAILELGFESKSGAQTPLLSNVYFFPEQPNVISPKPPELTVSSDKSFLIHVDEAQNGEKPAQLSGVLVSDKPLIGSSKAVYISQFTLFNGFSEKSTGGTLQVPTIGPRGGNASPSGGPVASALPENADDGHRPPLQRATTTQPLLLAVLGAAFIGGLILNLMPCVLPVLSLKVFSLMKHADDPHGAWKQGASFTAGVVISFWILAGLLLGLRAAGNHLGWGFQMQSPGFVLALILLFFLIALNLFGVFEVGTSLVGLDAKAASGSHGLTSSFLNGALATVAATPCTAPFMGSALGFAAQQPTFVAMLIFTFLALGMATPYLLLTIFPGALRFVPKPGAWMEAFRQFMGFLLMATVIWLVYVFGALTGEGQIPMLLFLLLLIGMITWIYGRWGILRAVTFSAVVMLLFGASEVGLFSGEFTPVTSISFPLSFREKETTASLSNNWQPWSPNAVDAALGQNRPVFVDFTAAWCLSCKVNEKVALDTDAVKNAFADKNVTLLLADWTHADPEISKTLQQYNRDGVPLYLLYSPKDKAAPQVLPAVLTPGIVLDAVKKL